MGKKLCRTCRYWELVSLCEDSKGAPLGVGAALGVCHHPIPLAYLRLWKTSDGAITVQAGVADCPCWTMRGETI
jgi:hypothetical protein